MYMFKIYSFPFNSSKFIVCENKGYKKAHNCACLEHPPWKVIQGLLLFKVLECWEISPTLFYVGIWHWIICNFNGVIISCSLHFLCFHCSTWEWSPPPRTGMIIPLRCCLWKNKGLQKEKRKSIFPFDHLAGVHFIDSFTT